MQRPKVDKNNYSMQHDIETNMLAYTYAAIDLHKCNNN
jgi:hypothetical protein